MRSGTFADLPSAELASFRKSLEDEARDEGVELDITVVDNRDGTVDVSWVVKPSTDADSGAGAAIRAEPGADGTDEARATNMRAKPGRHQMVIDKLIAGARAENLDPMLILTIVAIESDFDPRRVPPGRVSSAAGLFQFIDTTWKAAGGTTFPGRGGKGNGHAAGASVDEQVRIGCAFVARNAAKLRDKLGVLPTATQVYMAHQQGLAGALKILSANPDTAIESVIGDEAVRNNRFEGMTVAETIARFEVVVLSNQEEARDLVTTGAANEPAASVGSAAGGSIARKAVQIALNEMERFARNGSRIIRETEAPLNRRVLEYFNLVGRPDIVDPSAEPWSAAFISFVMHTAGAPPVKFLISPAHSRYILAGLANRINNNLEAPIVYFDKDERAPRVGDLVGFSRTAAVKNRADIERFLPDTFFRSHTDLVIEASDNRIKVIGGNVSQTILTTTIKTDGTGKIAPSEEHFFVLRVNL